MKNLLEYLKELGAIKVELVAGPKGKFIVAIKADESKFTLPVGRKSQNSKLSEMNVLITPEGQAIATANEYAAIESITL